MAVIAILTLALGVFPAAPFPSGPVYQQAPGPVDEPAGDGFDPDFALETALGLPTVLDYALSPDGRRVVLSVSTANRSNLFLAAAGAAPGPITRGRGWRDEPRFLPDGLSVVFVSGRRPGGAATRPGRLQRLAIGGEPVALTEAGLDVRAPDVSPDGALVAFLGRPVESGDLGAADPGFDVFVIPGDGGEEARRLTALPGDEGPPRWSPDGSRIAFSFSAGDGSSARGIATVATGEDDLPATPLVVVPPDPGTATVGEPAPAWTPDGRTLAFVGGRDGFAAILQAPADGSAPPAPLIAEEGIEVRSPAFRSGEPLEVAWLAESQGSVRIHRARLGAAASGVLSVEGRIRTVTRGAGVHDRLRWSESGEALHATVEGPAFPRDVWRFPASGGRERVSDTLFPEVDAARFARPEILEATAGDGTRIESLLYRPLSDEDDPMNAATGPDAPLIVHVRGPVGAGWRNGFHPVVQFLVGRGYAVLAPVVRGSGGRGAAFARANDSDWGVGDLGDLLAAARQAMDLPGVSGEPPCVWGVGYGGFLALAALSRHPDFFACGVEAMGSTDLATLYRVGSPAARTILEAELGPLRGNLATYRRLSVGPGEADRVSAPLLTFHSEEFPEAPFDAKAPFIEALRARPAYPLVEFTFRGDAGTAAFRPDLNRAAGYAYLDRIMEFLSLHLPVP